jgi:hypothetical protein
LKRIDDFSGAYEIVNGTTPTTTPPVERSQLWLAIDAGCNCRRFPVGHLDGDEESILLSEGVGNPLNATVKVLAGLPWKQD